MTAPAPVTRGAPTGTLLENGYQALITIGLDTDIDFWEKSVQPPSMDGGDSIDVTTQHNTTYRTRASSALVDLGETSHTVGNDPKIYDQILSVINTATTITVTFPDGSTLAYYGYLRTFEPSELSEGEFPEASVTITPTNRDSTGAEESPVYTAPA